MKQKLVEFIKIFGNINNTKTKKMFLENIENLSIKLKKKVIYDQRKYKLFTVRNIYVGDLINAKIIYVCGFDSSKNLALTKNTYYPLNDNFNNKIVIFSVIKKIVINFIFLLFMILLLSLNIKFISIENKILYLLMFLVLIATFSLTSKKIFRYNNINKVLSIYGLVEILKESKDINVAYAFCDFASYDSIGLVVLNDYLSDNNIKPIIIYLDSLGDGDITVISQNIEYFTKNDFNKLNDVQIRTSDFSESRFKIFKKIIHICIANIDNDMNLIVENRWNKKNNSINVSRFRNLITSLIDVNDEL